MSSNEVQKFTHACEQFLSSVGPHVPLTEQQRRTVEAYCYRLLKRVRDASKNLNEAQQKIS